MRVPKVFVLSVGYDRRKSPQLWDFRPMTFDEVANLHRGERVWFAALDGTARGIMITGKPKRWKTRPKNIEVPVRYGMYENARVAIYDGIWSDSPILLIPLTVDFPYTP